MSLAMTCSDAYGGACRWGGRSDSAHDHDDELELDTMEDLRQLGATNYSMLLTIETLLRDFGAPLLLPAIICAQVRQLCYLARNALKTPRERVT